jgi:hypothetical protein
MQNPLAILATRFDHGRMPRWLRRRITMTAAVNTTTGDLTLTYRFMGITFFRYHL